MQKHLADTILLSQLKLSVHPVPVGQAVDVALVLLVIPPIAALITVAIAVPMSAVLRALAIVKLVQNPVHLEQALALLRRARLRLLLLLLHRGGGVQAARGRRVEPAVGVPVALGVGAQRCEPVGLRVRGGAVAADGELGGARVVAVGARLEVGCVAAGRQVVADHGGALAGGGDCDGCGPVDAADPAHLLLRGLGLGVAVEVQAGDEALEGVAVGVWVSMCALCRGESVFTCLNSVSSRSWLSLFWLLF